MGVNRRPRGLVRAPFVGLVLTGALLAAAFACGGDDDTGSSDDSGSSPTPSPSVNVVDGAVTFDVTLTDKEFWGVFTPKAFTVPPGAIVTFNITNEGGATHNMRFEGEDTRYETDDDTVSEPEKISGGTTATLVWTAPTEPGNMRFRCDFHPMRMSGGVTFE